MMSFAASLEVKLGPSRSPVLRCRLKPAQTMLKLWSFTMRYYSMAECIYCDTFQAVSGEESAKVNPLVLSGSEHWGVERRRAHILREGFLGRGCDGGVQSSDWLEVSAVLLHGVHRWKHTTQPGQDVVRAALPGVSSDVPVSLPRRYRLYRWGFPASAVCDFFNSQTAWKDENIPTRNKIMKSLNKYLDHIKRQQ